MRSIIINAKKYSNQVPMEGDTPMSQDALNTFVRDLINEHATYKNGGLSLFASDLPLYDQRIFLSNITDADDFAWYCETESRLRAAIKENEDYMQMLINEQIDDVWHDAMQEKNLSLGRDTVTGEPYYYK